VAIRWLFQKTTPLDRIIVLALAIGVLSLLWVLGNTPKGARVVVEVHGEVVYTAPMVRDGKVGIDGPLGETEIVIRKGSVSIVDSPCPLKVCVGMGEVSRSGELLACVPNGILVRIEGGKEARDHDLISY